MCWLTLKYRFLYTGRNVLPSLWQPWGAAAGFGLRLTFMLMCCDKVREPGQNKNALIIESPIQVLSNQGWKLFFLQPALVQVTSEISYTRQILPGPTNVSQKWIR